MKFGKFIGAGLGYFVGGCFGSVVGYFLGSIVDVMFSNSSSKIIKTHVSRNEFMNNFLVLTAAVMKADGVVKKSELEYVKQFLRVNFGENQTIEALQILKDLLQNDVSIDPVCSKIRYGMQTALKLQILHYLFGIAKADGEIHQTEIYLLEQIAIKIGVNSNDYNSIKSMFIEETDSAYKILGVQKTASDEELKKAYRAMAVKHHPDKVANMGEDVQNSAKLKFQKINEAWDKIKKERGIK